MTPIFFRERDIIAKYILVLDTFKSRRALDLKSLSDLGF